MIQKIVTDPETARLDAEDARVFAQMQAELPPGIKLGSPHHRQRHLRPGLLQPGEWTARNKVRRLPDAERAEKANPAILENISTAQTDRMKVLLSPQILKAKAEDTLQKIAEVERRMNAEHVPVYKLHRDIGHVIRALAAMDVVMEGHRTCVSAPLTAHIHSDKETSVAEFFAGGFHIYKEGILPLLVSGKAKNGREALEIHARQMRELDEQLRFERDERTAIREEGRGLPMTPQPRQK